MKRHFVRLLSFVLVSSIPVISPAQNFGIELGGSYNAQNGSFVAPCGCTYAQGSGIGFFGAVSYDLFSRSGFTIGIEPGIEYQQIIDDEVFPRNIATRVAGGDQQQIKLTYLSIAPYIRYTISPTKLFLQISPGFSYLVSSRFHHIQGPSGDDLPPNFNPDTSLDVRATRYTTQFSAGYDLPISGIILAPMVTYILPLTVLRTANADGWKISSYSASIAFRFGL